MPRPLVPMALYFFLTTLAQAVDPATPLPVDPHWSSSLPLAGPKDIPTDHFYSIKDPSFVQVDNRWHLFCTVRGKNRPQQIEYLTFTDWNSVDKGERHMLPITDNYYCAPQVFYFRPQKKWYLLYQFADTLTDRNRRPGFSTNTDPGHWQDWTKPAPLFPETPGTPPAQLVRNWIDFWVICTDTQSFLFFTSDDGHMWRSQAPLADFPHGWSQPVLAIQGDIFEASHTYHLQGTSKYLTIMEAIGPAPQNRRYYQSYTADSLDGTWQPANATWEKPFASLNNTTFPAAHWADSISHGELIRASNDERMEADPANLRFVYQGVSDADMKGKEYGQIPWQLGILTPSPPNR